MLGDPLFAAYLTFTLVLVATPGSTTAVVVRNTLDGGRRAGVFAAAGAAIANAMHATAAGLGAGVLVARWPGALDAVRNLGGAYLAYLGLRGLWALRAQRTTMPDLPQRAAVGAHHRSLHEGVAVNILNPVILTLYLAVVPTFVRPSWPRAAFVVMAVCHVTLAFAFHCAWVLGLHRLRPALQRRGPRQWLGLATSLAMLALAARVLLS